MGKDRKLGATGKFPKGKLIEEDEGELRLAVGHKEGNVIVDFGKPVAWFALPPDAAMNLAEKLMDHAIIIQKERLGK